MRMSNVKNVLNGIEEDLVPRTTAMANSLAMLVFAILSDQ